MSEPTEEQKFRDEITDSFKTGKVGIENGWLVEYNEPCKNPCAGPYGCPHSCLMTPIVDLWRAGAASPQLIEYQYRLVLVVTSRNGDMADQAATGWYPSIGGARATPEVREWIDHYRSVYPDRQFSELVERRTIICGTTEMMLLGGE